MPSPPHRMAEDVLFCREAMEKGVGLFLDGKNTVTNITEKSYLRYTFYLGIATSMLRLSEATPARRAAFLMVLPIGSLYKLMAVIFGLWHNNPRHVRALIRRLPCVLLGLAALHAGMLAYPFARIRMRNSTSGLSSRGKDCMPCENDS